MQLFLIGILVGIVISSLVTIRVVLWLLKSMEKVEDFIDPDGVDGCVGPIDGQPCGHCRQCQLRESAMQSVETIMM